MGPIRSPLGALGAILVLLEGIAGATLFALDSDPHLRLAIVVTIISVFALTTLTVLGIVVYFAIAKPGFLFNPADVGQLDEAAQQIFLSTSHDDVVVKADVSLVSTKADITVEPPSLMAQAHEQPGDDGSSR